MSRLTSREAIQAMEAYLDQLESSGELPLYDRATVDRVSEEGYFGG
jgi:hypothetical protein